MNIDKTENFLLERQTGLGGSDMAAIMGLSPFKTALDIYYDKVDPKPPIDNEVLKRGRDLEEHILAQYSTRYEEVIETNLPMLKSTEYPFLIGHIDGKIKDQNVIIEAKSTQMSPSSWGNKIPNYYLV